MSRSGTDRWIRVGLLVLIVLSPVLFLLGITILFPSLKDGEEKRLLGPFLLLAIPAMMLAPMLLFGSPGSAPGPSDDDSDGGTGRQPPPSSPSGPRGGIPLPDAEPARVRMRDHARPWRRRVRPRRPAREPKPTRVPAASDG